MVPIAAALVCINYSAVRFCSLHVHSVHHGRCLVLHHRSLLIILLFIIFALDVVLLLFPFLTEHAKAEEEAYDDDNTDG